MSSPSVIIHCNAGGQHGLGHVMRALTLVQEADANRWSVTVVGDLNHLARRLIRKHVPHAEVHDIPRDRQQTELPAFVVERAPDVVHIDSYLPESDSLVGTAPLVSNIQDGAFGARATTLTIDTNLNAEFAAQDVPRGAFHLAGVPFALIREQVRKSRGTWKPSPTHSRVLLVLGGTDPFAQTPPALAALAAVERTLDITVVAPPLVHDDVVQLAARSPHNVEVVGFLDDLPSAAIRHDLVITTASTSLWDMTCLGVPTAVVCVAENQQRGYDAAVEEGLAIGLRGTPQAPWTEMAAVVDRYVDDSVALRELSARGMRTVDGLGPWRVVSAWASLLHARAASPVTRRFTARPAALSDAEMLLEWRNDVDTRNMSRSMDSVSWPDHIDWLTRVIADDDRQLFVIVDGAEPVGTVRWDHRTGSEWEVSIALAPSERGQGKSAAVLTAGEMAISADRAIRFVAAIKESNRASRRLFERAGYLPYLPSNEDGFAEYSKLATPVSSESASRLVP